MKVYLNHNEAKLKVKIPKKWKSEKKVRDVLQIFVDDFNRKNSDIPLDIATLGVFETTGTPIPLDATIGDALQDFQDLVVDEQKEVAHPFVQAVLDGADLAKQANSTGQRKAGPGTTTDRFNYSKWDNLDLSDDEKDFHPNIDNNLMIRLKREKREQMRAEEDAQIEKLKQEDTPEAQAEIERILEERAKRGLCGEDLCHDAWSHTSVNQGESNFQKIQSEKAARIKAKGTDVTATDIEEHSYTDFKEKYYGIMEEFAKMDPEKCEDFILENPEILQDEAAGHMLMHMLNLEMSGKTTQMKRAARQYLMLQNILDLSKQMKRDPRAAIRPFFKEILQEEKMAQLKVETEAFAEKISKRAIDKKKEMEAEAEEMYEERELTREERLGPGGLDPVEVFETLPESMQKAFESKDIPALQDAVSKLPAEEAKYHMKRCEDSGLWVPGGTDEDE